MRIGHRHATFSEIRAELDGFLRMEKEDDVDPGVVCVSARNQKCADSRTPDA